jgi:hypothetical protein
MQIYRQDTPMAIEIKIRGAKDISLRKTLRAASEFFIKDLMPRKRRLKVSVICKNHLEGLYGECHYVSAKEHTFKIYLDVSYDINDVLSTLAHEFVHVRQFCKKELNMTDSYARWQGEIYSYDTNSSEPWEEEAMELEAILLDKYRDG